MKYTKLTGSFGQALPFDFEIFGASHEKYIGAKISGLPAGEFIDMILLYDFMARRAPGALVGSTTRREADIPVFSHGLDGDFVTDGGEIVITIENTDARPSDYPEKCDIPRPSHADYTALCKYGEGADLRGGGFFSGRMTAPFCAVGGICLQILARRGVFVGGHIYSVGNISDTPFSPTAVNSDIFSMIAANSIPVINSVAGEQMTSLIRSTKEADNSIGGVVEVAVIGLPAGLGNPRFNGLKSLISSAVFDIPAVTGIEFGAGFASSRLFGSQNNDPYATDGKTVFTETNNSGGILGGLATGMPLIFRASLKPTPSVGATQNSVRLSTLENVTLNISGRHDACIVPRAVPCFEAAAAVALVEAFLYDGRI